MAYSDQSHLKILSCASHTTDCERLKFILSLLKHHDHHDNQQHRWAHAKLFWQPELSLKIDRNAIQSSNSNKQPRNFPLADALHTDDLVHPQDDDFSLPQHSVQKYPVYVDQSQGLHGRVLLYIIVVAQGKREWI